MGTPFKMKGPSLYNSPMKQGKTSWKSKAKSAWYTMMHHDGLVKKQYSGAVEDLQR
jgi:hypothetical protein